MRFVLHDIGKVKGAEMLLNGITVVVGNNNTGKTTISRALYAFVNSLCNIDGEVESQRKGQIFRVMRAFFSAHRRPVLRYDRELMGLVDAFVESPDDGGCLIRDFLQKRFTPIATMTEVEKCVKEALQVRSLSNKVIRNQIIENYFDAVFRGQCLSVRRNVEQGRIEVTVDGHDVSMALQKDGGVSYVSDINIQRKAYFVDTPDLLDFWGAYRMGTGTMLSASIRNEISQRIANDGDRPADSAFDDLMFAAKYGEFMDGISRITGGRFDFDQNKILKFVEPDLDGDRDSAFDLNNVSEGLKAFGVLELLLRYRLLKEKDVLILDEPEVHLHPEWQLEYAQLIVALQKAFNLRVLITTHSSNFMLALQFYARIAGRADVINSYRIRSESNESHYSVVKSENPSDWDDAYYSFVNAANKMAELHERAFQGEKD